MEEHYLAMNRQRFLTCLSTAGLGSTLFPGALAAIAQDARVVTIEMLEAAEQIAGINFSSDEKERILARLNGGRRADRRYQLLQRREGEDPRAAERRPQPAPCLRHP